MKFKKAQSKNKKEICQNIDNLPLGSEAIESFPHHFSLYLEFSSVLREYKSLL